MTMRKQSAKAASVSEIRTIFELVSQTPQVERARLAELMETRIVGWIRDPEFLFTIADGCFERVAKSSENLIDPLSDDGFFQTKRLVYRKLGAEELLSETDRGWLRNYLEGQYTHLEDWNPRGLGCHAFWTRFLVDFISDFGFSKYRNETSGPYSAIDIVANVNLITREGPTSYSGVKAKYLSYTASENVD